MSKPQTPKRDLYYTNDHEWIDYQGSIAYIGICGCKLKGIKEIDQIEFPKNEVPTRKGEIIATISYDDYKIQAHLPIDGKVISINDLLSTGSHYLLSDPESRGWIAIMVPSQPYERKGLMHPQQYRDFIAKKI